jgi:hypothetical protein
MFGIDVALASVSLQVPSGARRWNSVTDLSYGVGSRGLSLAVRCNGPPESGCGGARFAGQFAARQRTRPLVQLP